MIESLLRMLARFLVLEGVAWLKDPDNRDDIEKAAVWVAEKGADITPWKFDDAIVDSLAGALSGKLNIDGIVQRIEAIPGQVLARIPDFNALAQQVVDGIVSRIPFLGGR